MRKPLTILLLAIAGAGHAAGPPRPFVAPTQFVTSAAANDLFEITSSNLLTTSGNLTVRAFAFDMITDHTKSAAMLKAAAVKSGLNPAPPVMTAQQAADVKALARTSGLSRDALYISQQKAAHAEALGLLKGEAATGKLRALRVACRKILPLVQHHKTLIDAM
jgi:putative membrane protein